MVVVGPTAAGKSALALELAEAVGGEILTVDSAQVHRGLDIGTAKPTEDERRRVPHHLIDSVGPAERLDAATWATLADLAIDAVRGRGRLPILCGGTGLWLRALLHGLSPMPDIDPEVRAAVRAELQAQGPEALHAALARIDPAAATRIQPRDGQRITRALEVHRQSGRTLSEWQRLQADTPPRHAARVYGLWPEREVLHTRIADRIEGMLARGWVEEVRALLAGGLAPDAPGLQTLGYREVVAHVQGQLPLEELPRSIGTGHRRYARRQLTWFRGITTREDGLQHLGGDGAAALKRILADIG